VTDQHARGGQRVGQQEAGGGEEHQRDQEQATVPPPVGRAAHGRADHHIHRRHRRDQPEMGPVVLPQQIGAGGGQQQPEPGDRQGEVEHPDHDSRHR
jgi:hypothetical protein